MRFIYCLLFYLVLPFVFVRLWLKSYRQPLYKSRLAERLGFYKIRFPQSLWVHAVSVGETIAAAPLIKQLQQQYPNLPIIVTTMTPTGASRVKAMFGDSVTHVYLPYDLPDAVQRFLRAMRPRIAIIMETELWPNLLSACRKKAIPVCLMNARLSGKSARRYAYISRFTKSILTNITQIATHGERDARRFIALGARPSAVMVTGNLKFDMEMPADVQALSSQLRVKLGGNRFIWIAASTHEQEEEILLAAHKEIITINPNALLILVPRHPDRFEKVFRLSQQQFKTMRRSTNATDASMNVYVGDTMGELALLYGASDVAFVGGSLIPRGGHNMLEPAMLGKPILTGIYLHNFAEISNQLAKVKALIKVRDANDLATQLIVLMKNETLCQTMSMAALKTVAANRGALTRQLQLVTQTLQATDLARTSGSI